MNGEANIWTLNKRRILGLILVTIFTTTLALGALKKQSESRLEREREIFVLKTILAGYGCSPEALAESDRRIPADTQVPSGATQVNWWTEIYRRHTESRTQFAPTQWSVIDPADRVRRFRAWFACEPSATEVLERLQHVEALENEWLNLFDDLFREVTPKIEKDRGAGAA